MAIFEKIKTALNKVRTKISSYWMFNFTSQKKMIQDHITLNSTAPTPGFVNGPVDRIYGFFRKKTDEPATFLLKIIVGIFILFVLWASFFHIDESVKGSGTIIPSKYVQIIDNLEGGIIKGILIEEGEIVRKDQAIIKLDTTQTSAKLNEIKRDYSRYQLTIDRLNAQIKGEPFTPSEIMKKNYSEFVSQEMGRYTSALEQLKKELSISQGEIDSRKFALKEKEEKLELDIKHLKLVQEQANIINSLYEKGLSSKLKHLSAEREILNLKNEVSASQEQIARLKAEKEQSEDKLKKVKVDFENQARKDLNDAELKLSELQSNKSIYEDRINRQEITSPIDGIVKEISVKTLGGVIQAGQSIMTIVPLNDELLAEVKIAPNDIGFVSKDSPVTIKIGPYDFTIYGSLNGKVTYISADTVQEKKEQQNEKTYFRVKVKADKNYLERYGQKYYLTPGMPVDVDLHTGRRTIMSFILKPILKTFDRAFSER